MRIREPELAVVGECGRSRPNVEPPMAGCPIDISVGKPNLDYSVGNPLEDDMALVAVGGLLTVKRLAPWYKPLLATDTTSELEPEERFIAPPRRGIASPEDMRAEFTEDLEEVHDKLGGKKMFLVGHSLGGLLATSAAVERPDMVGGVASLGGVHLGIRGNIANYMLTQLLGNPAEAEHIQHDSTFMQEHKERMATEWPDGVPLHVISTPLDILVVPPQGYGVELPDNRQSDDRLIVAPIIGIETAIKRFMRMPESVKPLKSKAITEHLYIPRNLDVIRYIDTSRRAANRNIDASVEPIAA